MRRRTWVALLLAFAMLVAIPAEAGTRTKTTAKRGSGGFVVNAVGESQIKLTWCQPDLQFGEPEHAAGDLDLPTQEAGVLLFGLGWAVMEEPQSWRSRDIQIGTLWLERLNGDVWEPVHQVEWSDGLWVESGGLPAMAPGADWAWTDPYEWTTPGGLAVWRIDWDLRVTLEPGTYAFSHINFELSKGTNATTGGDPPGPYFTYGDCLFKVA